MEETHRELRREYVIDFDKTFVITPEVTIRCGPADIERMNAFFAKWDSLARSEGLGDITGLQLAAGSSPVSPEVAAVRVYGVWLVLRDRYGPARVDKVS
jgi:hypothetical protein